MGRLSIRALSEAVRKVHFVEVSYEDEIYELPWMELQENEMPLLPTPEKDATESEVADMSVRGLDLLTFHMIAKGSEHTGDPIDIEVWDALPKRIKNDVMMRIFNIRVEAKKDFLDHPTKT